MSVGAEAPGRAVDWARVQAEFPVNHQFTWLNSCGIAPPPGPVVEAACAWLRAYGERGVFAGKSEWGVHDAVCGRLARLLGADPDELTLVHHTAEAMTFLSHGFDLRAGDRIVLLENEYPSNVYPWEHWRARGVAIDFVAPGRTPGEFLERFAKTLAPRTRVVSLSAVHWCTGLPLPLAEVGRLCEERGAELVVDAAQGAGLVPIDVRAMKISYLAFSAWKWLLGPLGLGALYVRRDKLEGLRFPFKGTSSVVDEEAYLPYRENLKPTTARFVVSTPNFNDWIYFDESLAYLERLGFSAVMERIHRLAAHLADALRARGFSLASDAFPEHPTGILSVHKEGHSAEALLAGLRRARVVAAVRLGRLRLAPHVFLSEAQLDAAADALGASTGA